MGRRANGEGSLYRRADGRWAGALTYVDDEGKTVRKTVYGKTQAAARSKLREARARAEAGQPVRDSTMSVATWLTDWMAGALEASDRQRSTKDLYAAMTRKHLIPALGTKTLAGLRPTDVEALVMKKKMSGLSASSVRTMYSVLRAALDIAVRDGHLNRNVCAAVPRPPVERKEATYLGRSDVGRLFEALRGERIEPYVRLLLATGLRRGEGLGLHWEDVDLEARTLRVRWTLSRTSEGLVLGPPKTEKSRRTIPLPTAAVDALRTQRRAQAAERLAAGEAWSDQDLVFTTEVGGPLEPRNVLRRFETVVRAADLEGTHLHTLRHSAASFLLAMGAPTKVAQVHLGHSSYGVTADVYGHVSSEQAREAADLLDQAVDW
ncbi:site-specific integrase [Kineococcus sp. NPDC059986]|jgi:integrase|uniref:tyrosine-type recombinase/integrase n=1 Tax=Kineococcus sp. NPDC059986 TaxID=3155538 RepID=UPI003450DD5B